MERGDPELQGEPRCARLHRRAPANAAGPAGDGHGREGRCAQARGRDVQPRRDPDQGLQGAHQQELAHDFLWRVEKETPAAGQIGIFDRSHYEDVLIGRVRALAPEEEIERRYEAIADFERRLARDGTTIVKCMMHISKEEQRERLLARLDDPTKVWKFKPERRRRARGLGRLPARVRDRAGAHRCRPGRPGTSCPATASGTAPSRSSYLLRDALREMELTWPEPDFDVEEQRRRLRE